MPCMKMSRRGVVPLRSRSPLRPRTSVTASASMMQRPVATSPTRPKSSAMGDRRRRVPRRQRPRQTRRRPIHAAAGAPRRRANHARRRRRRSSNARQNVYATRNIAYGSGRRRRRRSRHWQTPEPQQLPPRTVSTRLVKMTWSPRRLLHLSHLPWQGRKTKGITHTHHQAPWMNQRASSCHPWRHRQASSHHILAMARSVRRRDTFVLRRVAAVNRPRRPPLPMGKRTRTLVSSPPLLALSSHFRHCYAAWSSTAWSGQWWWGWPSSRRYGPQGAQATATAVLSIAVGAIAETAAIDPNTIRASNC